MEVNYKISNFLGGQIDQYAFLWEDPHGYIEYISTAYGGLGF